MIKNRFFWSWDHSTNWIENVPGAQICGVGNEYVKEPHIFELDYKRAIDFAAEHSMTGVGVVGMLRDRHGGVDAARRICSYAREKGTLIYIIAGLFAYGGIYYEGDHKYSLNRFFEKNPETIAVDRNGERVMKCYQGRGGSKKEYNGCASNPLLHEFVLESMDWLFREIPELGGIQMESGDVGVCDCPACRARRGADRADEPISIADMAAIYPDCVDTVLSRSPDALVICETYHHFLDSVCDAFAAKTPDRHLSRLLSMPKSVFFQWKCDRRLRDGGWKSEDRMIENLRPFRHIMRSHTGTQWWGGRNTLGIELIRRQCALSAAAGLDAVSMFGETSTYHTNAEFNYLALEYFANDPQKSVSDFAYDVMAPRLGGYENAQKYGRYAGLYRDHEKIPAAIADIAAISAKQTEYDVIRRWQYLAGFLNSYYYELRAGGSLDNMNPRDADRPDLF